MRFPASSSLVSSSMLFFVQPSKDVIKHKAAVVAAFGKRIIIPPRCLACARLVASYNALCAKCYRDMDFIEAPVCERTGDPLSYDLGEKMVSAQALANPPLYRKLRAATRYNKTAQKLIIAFKFYDRLELSKRLADWMGIAGRDLFADTDLIIPVPLHKKRLRERRFNQAAELAKEISKARHVPLALHALKRIRETKQQTTLDQSERIKNVQGAFHVDVAHKSLIHGKRILLIDDVMTTGATVTAATRALLRENARYVDVLTFAKVVDYDEKTI